MRTYEEKTVPQKTKTVLMSVTCDLCGEKAPLVRYGEANWNSELYEFGFVTVSIKRGHLLPDSDKVETKESYDICPYCFRFKLMPWLAAQGARPSTEETGY